MMTSIIAKCFLYSGAAMAIVGAIMAGVVICLKSNSPYDINPELPAPGVLIAAIILLFVGICLLIFGCIIRDIADDEKNYKKFENAISADSGYTVYYNGQAVSGSAILIDEDNIGDYKIKYDPVNKTVKIMG